MTEHVEVYEDMNGEYRWRHIIGANIVSDSGEGYVNKAWAVRMAHKLNVGVTVIDLTHPTEHNVWDGED